MSTVKGYFEFGMRTCCGIPDIYLLGTLEDWKKVKEKAAKLSSFDLEWWIKPLLEILDEIISTIKNGISSKLDFWKSFFK